MVWKNRSLYLLSSQIRVQGAKRETAPGAVAQFCKSKGAFIYV